MKQLLEAVEEIRATALAYPETYEESPWGDRVVKVNKKIFLFAGIYKERLSVTTKLPETSEQALEMPFAKPTGYGMGKSGWVSCGFAVGESVPVPLLIEWLDESYRAIAPKKIVARLPEFGPPEEDDDDGVVPAPTRGPVLFVGFDPYRSARGVAGLSRAAISSTEPMEPGQAALAAAAKLGPVAIVVDVCRNASEGIDFAGSIAVTEFGALPLAVVGIRDAKTERMIRDAIPGATLYSRESPGDPRVLKALAGLL